MKDRLNIWVCDINQGIDSAKAITSEEKRGIYEFFWTRDSKYIIYAQDSGGDENFHLYRVDPNATGADLAAFDLTPFPSVRAGVIALPKPHHDQMVVSLNQRDKRYFDAFTLEIATGKLTLLEQNPGDVDDWHADTQGVIRACTAQVGSGHGGAGARRGDGAFPEAGEVYGRGERVAGAVREGRVVYLYGGCARFEHD